MKRGTSVGGIIIFVIALIGWIGTYIWSATSQNQLVNLRVTKSQEAISNMLVMENGKAKALKEGLLEEDIQQVRDELVNFVQDEEIKSELTKKLDGIQEIWLQREFLYYYLADDYYVGKTAQTVKDIQKEDLENLETNLTNIVKEAGLDTYLGSSLNSLISQAIQKYDNAHNESGQLKKEALTQSEVSTDGTTSQESE